MSETGIVIVAWNAEAVIGACLDAALRFSSDVVVVDNASTDSTGDVVRARPSVRLIANGENRGFAAAANQGIRSLDCPFVLLLNPDAVLETPLDGLVAACRDPKVAAAGGKLLDGNGAPQNGFLVRRFPTGWTLAFEVLGLNRFLPGNPVNRRYRHLDFDPERAADVDQPAGALLMLRRDVWASLGGFAEEFYPLWFEDVDYAKRARAHGYRLFYVPDAVARHRGGYSAKLLGWEQRQIYWYANLLRYAAKHLSGTATRGVGAATALSVIPRTVAGMLAERSLRPVSVCGNLLKLSVRRVLAGAESRKNGEPVPAL
ncbi:MAG: glycosyltransferase family 2 protein [Acidobacteriales bacterium]|nr:glycosyltransferase family 2 protein [Terriglobales bacterium]